MADPALVSTGYDVLLRDGSTAHLRMIRPDDAEAILALHGRLSPESIRLRYFSAHPRLSGAEVARLTHLRGPDDLALVAERGGVLLAVAEYDRTTGSDEAEVAFAVDDDYQGRGLGTMLLEHLASNARRHGIKRFVAHTLWENRPMLRVLRDAGFAPQVSHDEGTVKVILDIAPSPSAVAAANERDRVATVTSMARLLTPRAVAVIGASRDPHAIGHVLVHNLVAGEFNGPVYPVNPSATSVAGLPCWPTVEAVPGPIDLAIVAVPAAGVPEVVSACGRKGVGGLVIITAGFAEAGPGGAAAQRTVAQLAHANGMRVVGPNCFGVINTDPAVSMNATFAAEQPVVGRIGFGSQSGGLGIAILSEARARGLGLSSFVSTGNKVDVSSNDLIMWWEQDPATSVMLLYLESFGDPQKFARLARRVSRAKPIVAVKSGRSSAGTRAASSHTAALASSDQAVDALFHQTGVVRVDTIEELFDVAGVLADQPIARGRRVGVVSNAGGPGVLAADAAAAHHLSVPELSAETQAALAALLPGGAGLKNPVDLIASASAETYRSCLSIVLHSGEVDAVVVIFTPPLGTDALDVADAVADAVDDAADRDLCLPVVATFLGAPGAPERLRAARRPVPCFTYPETAVRALAHAVDYGTWRLVPESSVPELTNVDANEARRRLETAARNEAGWVTGADAEAILAAYGITSVATVAVATAPEAVRAAAGVDGPVVLKATGPGLVHKSDVGGVRLALRTPEEVADAFVSMQHAVGTAMTGAIVQPMLVGGVETIAGFVVDPAFGPQVLFGLGGTAVELLGDHAIRLVPLTERDAHEMVLGLRGTPLLTGYRGSAPVDHVALVDLILRLGRLSEDLPEIVEAECNPILAMSTGAVVVDARLRAAPEAPSPRDAVRHLR